MAKSLRALGFRILDADDGTLVVRCFKDCWEPTGDGQRRRMRAVVATVDEAREWAQRHLREVHPR